MKLRIQHLLGIIGMLALAAFPLSVGAGSVASQPSPFSASGPIAVTSIAGIVPAGASGRVRIQSETSASIDVLASDSPLAGTLLSLQQKSNELFSSPNLPSAVALDGSSVGTFAVVNPYTGAIVTSGQYHVRVSNVPGCQILDQGEWSTTRGGLLLGRGTVTACLNFAPGFNTFVGWISFTGTMN